MKLIKILAIALGLIGTVFFLSLGFVFTNPGPVLNEKNFRLLIDKLELLDEYSFESLAVEHTYEKWNQRQFAIAISEFCYKKTAPSFKSEGCLKSLDLDFRIKFFPMIEIEYLSELDILFSQVLFEPIPIDEESEEESSVESLELKSTLQLIEDKWIPDLSLKIDSFQFVNGETILESPILMTKRNKTVSAEFFDFHLIANTALVSLQGPDSYLIPTQTLSIENFSLVMSAEDEKWNVDFASSVKKLKVGLKGFIPNNLNLNQNELLSNFEELKLSIEADNLSEFEKEIQFLDQKSLSRIKFKSLFAYKSNDAGGQLEGLLNLDFQNNNLVFSSNTAIPPLSDLINKSKQAQADLLASTMIEFELNRQKHEWNQLKNLDLLPAPLNAMDGKIRVRLWGEKKPSEAETIFLNGEALVDFESAEQDFKFNLKATIPYHFLKNEVGTIATRLEVGKIKLSLPRVSTTSMPPQVIPDQRFKLTQPSPKKEIDEKTPKLNFDFVTNETKPLEIASNLLDEPLRLVVNLNIVESELNQGTIQLLPLRTTFFRRPILVKDLVLKLAKDREPYLTGVVEFLLPEYKVSLNLEGPIQSVRSYFTSDPPLQLDDIYAVLLFGRPMTDLDAQAKSDAQRSAQVLSQSILSLTTLYFFAGSPVESLGYDPDKAEVSAQFGLSRNSSLRVSSQDQGERSAGVRRNLGRGWYLDTSVQQNSSQGTSGQAVLLERIIAY